MKFIYSFLVIVLATLFSQEVWGTDIVYLIMLFWVGAVCFIVHICREKPPMYRANKRILKNLDL